ncbi:MAG: DUF3306 domain-containing protein [Pseudomonadota bacterium]
MSRPEDSGEDGFLGRWSRLKRQRETEAAAPVAEVPEAAPVAEKTEEELLEELGLPVPESLQPGDDFAAFMKEAVPHHLRRRALRMLWGSNPVLANLDELLDYGEDFTDAATVVENLQTAWQVGRGFRDDPEAVADGAEAPPDEMTASDDDTGDDTGADAVDEAAAPAPSPDDETDAPATPADAVAAAETVPEARPDEAPTEPVAARRRRMRFEPS